MKKYFALLTVLMFFLGAQNAYARQIPLTDPSGIEITASGGAPIPASFDFGDSQSLIISGLSGRGQYTGWHTLSEQVYINVATASTSGNPSDSASENFIIPHGSGAVVSFKLDPVRVNSSIFIRCENACTTGKLIIHFVNPSGN